MKGNLYPSKEVEGVDSFWLIDLCLKTGDPSTILKHAMKKIRMMHNVVMDKLSSSQNNGRKTFIQFYKKEKFTPSARRARSFFFFLYLAIVTPLISAVSMRSLNRNRRSVAALNEADQR